MRRFVLILLALALVVPATALAVRSLPGDGTLVVDNGRGVVVVRARGGIIGRFDSGSIVFDLSDTPNRQPVVWGAERIQSLGGDRVRYTGEDIRFRFIGIPYAVRVQAVGIDVSAVGRGMVILDASGFSDFPGRYSLNGSPFASLPNKPTTFQLGTPPPPVQIGK
jgi:hypothetical protein